MPKGSTPSSRKWASAGQKRWFRATLVARDGTRCHWCGRILTVNPDGTVFGDDPSRSPTIDHVVERRNCTPAMVKDTGNMVLSCPPCNNDRVIHERASQEFVDLDAEEMDWINDPGPSIAAGSACPGVPRRQAAPMR